MNVAQNDFYSLTSPKNCTWISLRVDITVEQMEAYLLQNST